MRWLDDVENDLKQIFVNGWRKMTVDRDAWKFILKEARVFHGPNSGEERMGKGTDKVCCFQKQEKTGYKLQEEM